MIDADGWLHTGDQARIADGRVYLTGRIKDILVLSNGENVSPADMEAAICLDPLFEQALVAGEGKAFLSAVLVLNPDLWFGFARELGLDPLERESLHDEHLHRKVLHRVQVQLKEFPGYAKIRRVCLQLDPWTVEDGLVTPTLKVKRAKVSRLLSQQIEALYTDC
jgi:long-chain acyl-CoA synthetase